MIYLTSKDSVTHDPEVGDVAQRKIILEHGRIVNDIDQSEGSGQ